MDVATQGRRYELGALQELSRRLHRALRRIVIPALPRNLAEGLLDVSYELGHSWRPVDWKGLRTLAGSGSKDLRQALGWLHRMLVVVDRPGKGPARKGRHKEPVREYLVNPDPRTWKAAPRFSVDEWALLVSSMDARASAEQLGFGFAWPDLDELLADCRLDGFVSEYLAPGVTPKTGVGPEAGSEPDNRGQSVVGSDPYKRGHLSPGASGRAVSAMLSDPDKRGHSVIEYDLSDPDNGGSLDEPTHVLQSEDITPGARGDATASPMEFTEALAGTTGGPTTGPPVLFSSDPDKRGHFEAPEVSAKAGSEASGVYKLDPDKLEACLSKSAIATLPKACLTSLTRAREASDPDKRGSSRRGLDAAQQDLLDRFLELCGSHDRAFGPVVNDRGKRKFTWWAVCMVKYEPDLFECLMEDFENTNKVWSTRGQGIESAGGWMRTRLKEKYRGEMTSKGLVKS